MEQVGGGAAEVVRCEVAESRGSGAGLEEAAVGVLAEGSSPGWLAGGDVLVDGVHGAEDGVLWAEGPIEAGLVGALPSGEAVCEGRSDAHAPGVVAFACPCEGAVGAEVAPCHSADFGESDAEEAEADGGLVAASLPGAVGAGGDECFGFRCIEPAGRVGVLDLAVRGWIAAAQDGEFFFQVQAWPEFAAVAPAEECPGKADAVAYAVVGEWPPVAACEIEHIDVSQGGRCPIVE